MLFKKFLQNKMRYDEFKQLLDNKTEVLDQIMSILGFTKYKELAEYLGVGENYISKAKREGVPDRWLMYIAMAEGIPLFFLMSEIANHVPGEYYRYVPINKIYFQKGQVNFSDFEKIFVPKSMLNKYYIEDFSQLGWFVNFCNSMSPIFNVGDLICCELCQNFNPYNGGIYLIKHNGLASVCRLQVLHQSYRIYYDNKNLIEEEEVQEVDIIARILYTVRDFI